jgi:hypothetical protein
MAQQKLITGNNIVHDNSTVLAAGNVGSRVNQLTVMSDLESVDNYGSKLSPPLGVASSGNLGIVKPVAGGQFAYQEEGQYIGIMLTNKIAGVASTVQDIPGNDVSKHKMPWVGYTREGISDISAFTGEATYNAGRGVQIKASGVDGVVGPAADHAAPLNSTMTAPGEFSYMKTGKTPTNDTYKARTSN